MENQQFQTDQVFEKWIRRACWKTAWEIRIALVFVGLLGIVLIVAGLSLDIWELSGGGLGVFALGFFVFRHYSAEIKGGNYWLDRIKNRPYDFVWIKPVARKDSVAAVETINTEQYFQLLTLDGSRVGFKCNSQIEQRIFLNGVSAYLPDVHIGYSRLADELYHANPKGFITGLRARKAYAPAASIGRK